MKMPKGRQTAPENLLFLHKERSNNQNYAIVFYALRYYIIDLQESPKINFLSMNHCSHDLNELIDPMVEALAWLKLNINDRTRRSMM